MKRIFKQLIVLVAGMFWISTAHGQNSNSTSQKFGKHFTISAYLNPEITAPVKSLEEGMRTYGFGHTRPRDCFFFFCIPETDFPKTYSDLTWMGKITYHHHPNYGLSLLYSVDKFGETVGYSSSVGKLGIEHEMQSISTQLTIGFYDIISLSAGPSLHTLRIKESSFVSYEKSRKLGADMDLTLRFPKKSLFFVSADIHYKWAGNYSVGPYSKSLNNSTVTFQETKVNYNHLTVAYGFGVRF